MKLKYKCPPSGKSVELWKIATDSFLEVVKNGLVVLKNLGDGKLIVF